MDTPKFPTQPVSFPSSSLLLSTQQLSQKSKSHEGEKEPSSLLFPSEPSTMLSSKVDSHMYS